MSDDEKRAAVIAPRFLLNYVMKLNQRLGSVAGFIRKDANVADIGSDHGYLPVYLALNNNTRRIIASDISRNSLKAAMRSAEKYGVADKIEFIVTDGMKGMDNTNIDTIVIAGMGGETISKILSEAPWTKTCDIDVILQPQTKVDILCLWLHDNGYRLRGAKLAREKGKTYIIMLVGGIDEYNATQINNEFIPEIELISVLINEKDPLYDSYMSELISKSQKAADGMMQSDANRYAWMNRRIEILTTLRDNV